MSYYSRPPATWNLPPHLSSEVVAAAKEGFDFQELEEDNKRTMRALKFPNPASSVICQSPGFTDGVVDEKDLAEHVVEEEGMETSEDEEDLSEEDEIESDVEEVEETNKMLSNKGVTEEQRIAKNAHPGILPTSAYENAHPGKQLDLDNLGDVNDAYDFNTDYV